MVLHCNSFPYCTKLLLNDSIHLVIASTQPSLFKINGFAFYAFVCLVHVQSVKKYKCKKAYGKIEFCSFARKVRVFIKALDFGISPIIRWMH